MRAARSTSCSAVNRAILPDLVEIGADRVSRGRQFGVLAGLAQRRRLVLVSQEVLGLLQGVGLWRILDVLRG